MESSHPAGGVAVVDRFLTDHECSVIHHELQFAYWRPSLTYQRRGDGTYRHVLAGTRVSETAHQDWFSPALTGILADVETRLAALFGAEPSHLEWWQATTYGVGGKFDPHLDAGYWDDHPAGDRTRSFVLYLNTPGAGGATEFRALDLSVEAVAGRLLTWRNLFPDGRPNHGMIHAGTPVREGHKSTLVTWHRQRRFRTGSGTPGSDRGDDE